MDSDGGKGRLRERVIETATTMFVRSGYSSVSMREIAASLGVSKAALYYHFADKQTLMLAILEGYLLDIQRLIEEQVLPRQTCRERIGSFVRLVFAQPPGTRAIMRLASQESGKLTPVIRATFLESYHKRFISKVESMLAEGVARGELRNIDPVAATWILLGMMYPFFYGEVFAGRNDLESLDEQIVSIFFDGAKR